MVFLRGAIYDNDPKVGEKYGELYNWYVVDDLRELTPEGWRIPTTEDWRDLLNFFAGVKTAGKYLKSKEDSLEDGGGNNRSKLNILPAGNRHDNGEFHYVGEYAYFWTSVIFADGNLVYQTFVTGHDFVSTTTINRCYGYSIKMRKRPLSHTL